VGGLAADAALPRSCCCFGQKLRLPGRQRDRCLLHLPTAGGAGAGGIRDAGEAQRLLQQAFAEGDLLLCVNVPPRWQPGGAGLRPFAATRVGVLWNCTQVLAEGGGAEVSWSASERDLFGRSLPSQGYGSGRPLAGAFVSQDNTHKVMQGLEGAGGWAETGGSDGPGGLPASFTIQRGTVLADSALAADCEAVLAGRCSVAALQAWPATHPFALNDQLMVHALAEGELGLPAWLASA
jgi:hypothetical protein